MEALCYRQHRPSPHEDVDAILAADCDGGDVGELPVIR